MSAADGAEEAVYHENQENMAGRLRGSNKSRLENQENVNASKQTARTVLGALANNQRRQPALRGSKQVRVVSVVRAVSLIPLYFSIKCAHSAVHPALCSLL